MTASLFDKRPGSGAGEAGKRGGGGGGMPPTISARVPSRFASSGICMWYVQVHTSCACVRVCVSSC